MMTAQFSAIPADLITLPHWVVWRYEDVTNRSGETKRTKVPYNARTGNKASSTNHKTWCDFQTALDTLNAGHGDGIGFVVTVQSGIVGIDLDHCFDPTTGELKPVKLKNGATMDAIEILAALDSYTEITPSGEGLRVFVRGTLPPEGRKAGDFEIYSSGRFLTITGRHFTGTPGEIHDRTAEISSLHARIFGAPKTAPALLQTVSGHTGTDSELLSQMFNSATGGKLRDLFSGAWQAHYTSQSEADSALCFALAFWTGRDAARIDSLFRQSGLMRPKWDEGHFTGGDTYGAVTIRRACEKVSETYSPTKNVILRGAGTRAWIRGGSMENAEAHDEPDVESAAESDADEAARRAGLYVSQYGRTFLLIGKVRDQESGSEESQKKLPVWDGAAEIHSEILGEDGEHIYQMQGRTRNGRRFEVEIPAQKMTDPKTVSAVIKNHAGAGCVFYAGMEKHIAPSIDTFTSRDQIQRIRRFRRVGWTADGAEFIIPGMAAPDMEIVLDRDLPYRVIKPEGAALSTDAQTAFRALLQAHTATLSTMAVCYALLAPLAGVAGWRDDRFGLFIAGRTGQFKTSYACMVLCLYGDFPNEDRLLKFGMGATLNAMLSNAADVRDMVMGVDNFKPGTGNGQKDAQSFVHAALEGGERKRLNRDGTRRATKEIYCWPMMTGEDTIDDAASVARMLIVPARWEGAENPALTTVQGLCHALPEVGGLWLQWLSTDDARETAAVLSRQFPQRRAQWAAKLRRLRPDMVNAARVASSLALLESGWLAALQCGPVAAVLEQYDTAFQAGLLEVAQSMGDYAAQSHEANRYIGALRALLDTQRAYLLPPTTDPDKDDRRAFLGWETAEHIYLQPDAAFAEVTKFLRDSGGLNGLGMNTIHKQLDQLGYLTRKDKGHFAVPKRLGFENRLKRVLWLDRGKVLEEGDGADE